MTTDHTNTGQERATFEPPKSGPATPSGISPGAGDADRATVSAEVIARHLAQATVLTGRDAELIAKAAVTIAEAIEARSPAGEDSVELACAWSDYRADYDIPGGVDPATAHRLFRAGWAAHRDGDTRGPMR